MKKPRKYVLKVRRSRKSYLFLYFLVLIVLGVTGYLYFSGYNLKISSIILAICFSFLVVYTIEIFHRREWWAISESRLIHSVGILNKNVRDVDFSSISDLDIDKPLFKRMLNYGTVNVRVFLSDTSIPVRDIHDPEGFIDILEDYMAKDRRKKHGIRKA